MNNGIIIDFALVLFLASWKRLAHIGYRLLASPRIGHSFLTHGRLLRGGTCPRCQACGVDMTVEHILFHCVSFALARDHSVIMAVTTQSELFSKVPSRSIIEFIHKTVLYRKIWVGVFMRVSYLYTLMFLTIYSLLYLRAYRIHRFWCCNVFYSLIKLLAALMAELVLMCRYINKQKSSTYLLMQSSVREKGVSIAVRVRFGLNLCQPHSCQCGMLMKVCNARSFVCNNNNIKKVVSSWSLMSQPMTA
jgi:hypothetical protein